MKTILKFLTVSLILTFFFSSCEDKQIEMTKDATVKITVKDDTGNALSNVTVYRFSEETWTKFSDDGYHADGQSITNAQGIATFSFDAESFLNKSKTYHFACEYKDKKDNLGVTFAAGDTVSRIIILR